MSLLESLFRDYTVRTVALGCAVLGFTSGVLGCFAVLRRQGLIGDTLSHAALPGVCLAFMLTGVKTPIVLMLGAAFSGWLALWLVLVALRRTRMDTGSALGVALSIFFGLGVVLLTVIQRGKDANQAGLDKFLFGQAAGLVQEQVVTMTMLGAAALGIVVLLFKEFKALSFDPEFLESLGYPGRALGALLTSLLLVAVVIGLSTVGVVLMSALLVAPAAAARQWTNSLGRMLWIAGGIGVACGLVGAIVSVTEARLPTGPIIVLSLSAVVLISVLLGSARGVVWDWRRQAGHRRRLGAGEGSP